MTVMRSNHPTVSLAGSMYCTFNLGAVGGGGGRGWHYPIWAVVVCVAPRVSMVF